MGRTADVRVTVGPRGLTCSAPDEPEHAWAARTALVRASQRLVAVCGHDPDRSVCDEAGCALARCGAAHWCVLAHRLSGLDDDPPEDDTAVGAGDAPDAADAAVVAFRAGLTAATEAVRYCRRNEHPLGRCWFGTATRPDGCGEVLRAAHRG